MTQFEGRVVVGVSLSLSGLEALRHGLAEARSRAVPLYAVRAYHLHPAMDGPDARQCREEMAAAALRTIHDAFDSAVGGVPEDIELAIVTVAGRADIALTRFAAGRTSLLVLGGRARSRRMNWIVRYCLRGASCPVTVVPPPELADRAGRWAVRGLLRDVEGYADSVAAAFRPRRD
jgi:nucleotide-binding universal stress UspA family protein